MKYTFVIEIDNTEFLEKKISAIEKIDDCQLIFCGDKEYKTELLKKHPDAVYICGGNSMSADYNRAMEYIEGDIVNFSFSSCYITYKDIIKIMKTVSENPNRSSYCVKALKASAREKKNKNAIEYAFLSVISNYDIKFLYLGGWFFKKSAFSDSNIVFNEKLGREAQTEFLTDVLVKSIKYIPVYNAFCRYTVDPINSIGCSESETEEWYVPSMDNFILPLLKKYPINFVQNLCLDMIMIKLYANVNAKDKGAITEEKRDLFFEKIKESLELIRDEVIVNYRNILIPRVYNNFIFNFKYGYSEKADIDSCGRLKYGNFNNLNNTRRKITINAVNNFKDFLTVDAEFNELPAIKSGCELEVRLNDKKIPYRQNSVYSKTLLLGKCINEKYTLNFKINKSDIKNNSVLSFFIKFKDYEEKLNILFNSTVPQARLTRLFPNAYWKYGKSEIMTVVDTDIIFKTESKFGLFIREIKLLADFLFKSRKKSLGFQAFVLRIIYHLTRPFYKKKNIWITFDKLYKGGDNGEYFYQYCLKQNTNIDCYYVINKTAYDYKRLKHQKNILKFKSLREYLTVLNAQCVFATHVKPLTFFSFTSGKEKYFRDLFNFDIFCLQHGLTIQDIPHLQNRMYDNTKLYFCASDYEISNISKPEYDYKEYGYIQRTGIPRFDGLDGEKSKNKKEILITPTWRSNMANRITKTGSTRPYYDEFKNTVYFKIYNGLINDKRLISTAEKYGYTITYLLHPTLSEQISDFDRNDYVNIHSVTEDQSYEKLLTESSVMVTDYSGVQFDFAYMKKPIVYYHPEELPPHYGAGGIDYETMGFGPIIKTREALVDKLCELMKSGCKNDDIYIDRCKKFFLYDDFDSCKRIYDASVKFLENREEYIKY